MKKVVGAVAILAVVGLGLPLVLVWTLDAESLGREAIRRVNEIEGVRLEADDVVLRPFSGLKLSNARAWIRVESGELAVSVRSLCLRHRLWPLLRRRLSVRSIYLEDPTLQLVSGPGEEKATRDRRDTARSQRQPKEAAESLVPAASAVDVEVSVLQIQNGRVIIRQPGVAEPSTEVEGFDLTLSDLDFDPAAGFEGLSGSGDFAALLIRAGDTQARDARGRWLMEEGRVTMTGVGFSTASADLEMRDLRADLSLDPFTYSLELEGDIDLNTFVGAQSDRYLGAGVLALQAAGSGPDTKGLEGGGTVSLEPGKIPAPAVVQQLERLLGREILTGRPYAGTKIRFSMADNVITVEPFDLVSEEVELGIDGLIGLDGPLDLTMRVRAPRDQIDLGEEAETVLDALTNDEGWVEVPFRVTGTFELPSVVPAWDDLGETAVDAAIDAAKKKLEEEGLAGAARLLDRLLDRDDEE